MSSQKRFINKAFNIIHDNMKILNELEIKLDIVKYEDLEVKTFAYTEYSENDKNIPTIVICNDLTKYAKHNPIGYQMIKENNTDYFKSLNIEMTDQSLLTFILLHEFGHIEQNFFFIGYSIEHNIFKHNEFLQLNEIILDRYFIMTEENNKILLDYFTTKETYAELFKYKYFPTIWNLIKE